MSETTIEWTRGPNGEQGYSFNPWLGCEKISPACQFCYAESWAKRAGRPELWSGERRRTRPENWRQPLKWDREAAAAGERRRVFCASLADVFDNQVPPTWRADLFDLIKQTPNLDWLLLTKRIGNTQRMVEAATCMTSPPDNVWIGATICNQEEADRDIPKLLAVPARIRFLSCEPLLGDIDITEWLWGTDQPCASCPRDVDCECGWQTRKQNGLPSVDWVIAGGESSSHARPSHPDWFRSLRDQCVAAGIPYLHKQNGEWLELDGDKPTRTVVSNAPEYADQAARCDGFISHDGHFVQSIDEAREDTRYRGMVRAGKKAAGRLLDGREHNDSPRTA